MHLAGKIFGVLNILLVIAFVLLAGPVAKERIDRQKELAGLQAKIPGLQAELGGLHADRVRLQEDLVRLINQIGFATTSGANRRAELEARNASVNDSINDSKAKTRMIVEAVANTEKEVKAREDEIALLTQENAADTASAEKLTGSNAAIREQLQQASSALERALQGLQTSFAKLLELEDKASKKGTASELSLPALSSVER